MRQDMLKQAAVYHKEHRQKVKRYKIFSALAAAVVFCTTMVLIMPAATMENAPKCGLEEHVHTEECQGAEVEVLTCELEESEGSGHVHGNECYETVETTELTCGLEEARAVAGHTHDGSCYTVEPVYETQVITVEDTETQDVLDEEGNVVGSETVLVGSHEEEAQVQVGTNEVLTCGQAETAGTAGHTHDESCYTVTTEERLICIEEESQTEGHTHSDACYEMQFVYACGLEEHTHTDECCQVEDGDEPEEEDIYLRDEDGNLILDEDGNPILKEEEPEEAEKPDAQPEMALLPYGAEVPEGYTVRYDCVDPDGAFAVTVYAPEEALPEEAVLVASLLPEGTAGYENAASALDEDSYDGMVAMDIHFEVEGWGEIEPWEPVYVVINAMGVLPADADPDSVAIQHHEEPANGGIMTLALLDDEDTSNVDVVVVADSSEETGIVEVTETAFDADVAAAFEVDGFSTFTITYRTSGHSYELEVHIVDKSGQEIAGQVDSISLSNANSWQSVESNVVSKLSIVGYKFVDARANSASGTHVSHIRYYNNGWQSKENSSNEIALNTLYLVYESDPLANTIRFLYRTKDNITSGTKVAENSMNYTIVLITAKGEYLYLSEYLAQNPGLASEITFPEDFTFDTDHLAITAATVSQMGISIPGYTFTNGYAYFYWAAHFSDNGIKVTDIKNAGRYSDKYGSGWNYLGYAGSYYADLAHWETTEPGGTNYGTDYTTGNDVRDLTGYWAYDPTGSLRLVFRAIAENPALKVNYVDAYLNGGYELIEQNDMEMQYDASRGSWYGRIEELTNIVPSREGYKFLGWYSGIDSDGNGAGEQATVDGATVRRFSDVTYYAKWEEISTYTVDLLKVSGSTTTIDGVVEVAFDGNVPLANAEFVLTGEGYEETVTTGDFGHATFEDLKPGEYTLQETKAPAGYNLLADEITFTIDENGTITTESDYARYVKGEDGTITLMVANIGGYVLPSTGGPGTTLYALGGMLLMPAAAFLMYKNLRERRRAVN